MNKKESVKHELETTSFPGLFPKKNGWGAPPTYFKGKAPGTRLELKVDFKKSFFAVLIAAMMT